MFSDMSGSVMVLIFVLSVTVPTVSKAERLYWGHKLVKAFPSSDADVKILTRLRDMESLVVDMWLPPTHPGAAVDLRVSPLDFIKLRNVFRKYKIRYKVQISDLQMVINRQNDAHSQTLSWHSKYHTLEQIISRMKVINQTSGMVALNKLGKSHENRDLYIMQIQARRQVNKPLIFINCGMHAREWVSPATCMYIIDQVVSLYGKDPSVTSMMDKVDLAILPVLNVDGYAYSWTKDRLWRKNRSPNKGFVNCVGTDLNRNWKFGWGGPGASTDPCKEDFQGVLAMSENEVQHVDRFLKSQLKRLVGYLDVHSYSQLWLIPWGYAKENVKDYNELMAIGKAAVETVKSSGFNTTYTLGSPSRLLYLSTGTLQDYVYGSLGVKYSFAVELRDKGQFGFILPPSLIEPTAKELYEGLKAVIQKMKVN